MNARLHFLGAKYISLHDVLLPNGRGARKEHVRAVQQDAQERHMKMNSLICPKCGGALKPREGRHGSFYGCANYPRCRFTMP